MKGITGRLSTTADRVKKIVSDFIFGMSTYEIYRETLHIARSYKDSVYLLLLGEFLGIPFISNYYALRLLPYLVGELEAFKRRSLREKDLLEVMSEFDAH
ncbi:hypothetical protein ATG_16010 [Desulfurococcaceae archaeon AG1]|jgi:hypothetical protein|nr:MAG: hypothetical protein DJ555_05590 [Desulfurococcaceae archaeon]GAY26397.1 hypothetical protein ATG_16010 [Desulfurococcaceae archaeon AG1]